MGVINITPNSFSDGGQIATLEDFRTRLSKFGEIDAIDVGAESTAPMNDAVFWEEEWLRIQPYLDLLKNSGRAISIDTYHQETIGRIAEYWLKHNIKLPLIWNDVSGKIDHYVKAYLAMSPEFHYVFCHNRAPIRKLTIRHMDYVSSSTGEEFLDEVAAFLRPYIHPRIIFDPALGFSKSYEQNWLILERFSDLQKRTGHHNWLIGFSRKSFIRKKLGIESLGKAEIERLDLNHQEVLQNTLKGASGTIWVRTHRPELLK